MEIKFNITDSKKDLVKAGNATTAFKDVIGTTLKMTGILIYTKTENNSSTGNEETKTVSCIKCADGEFITSISPTVENSLLTIIAAYDENEIKEGLEVVVKSKQSNGGRDFLYIDLV